MIVIIEGPDGAGKSTLARAVAKRFKLRYHHEGPPSKGVNLLWYYGELLNDARRAKTGIVFDRLALGERVYGPIFRQADRIGADGWVIFDRLAKAAGACQVLCLPSFGSCYAHWSARNAVGKETFTHSLQEVWMAFGGFASTSDVVYNWEAEPLETLIAGRINAWRDPANLPPGWTGSPHARTLIVADRASQADRNPVDVPFFGTQGSGPYLTHALSIAGLSEHDLAFVNAWDAHRDRPTLMPKNLGTLYDVVITLGERASATLRDLCGYRGPFQQVPHPQFWKRFCHHDIDTYADLIQEALGAARSQ